MKHKIKEIMITTRDEEIMKNIAVEPATLSQIRNRYFSGDRISSLAAASRRMTKLAKAGYLIKTLKNGKLHFAIGERGAQYLCEKLGYEKNQIKIIGKAMSFMIRRKKRKNEWIEITQRDMAILEMLAAGPSTFSNLRKLFFCSESFARRRLLKLSRLGYIKKVIYPSRPSVLFYIAEKGAQELMNVGYDEERIRMNVVRGEEVEHELMVTELIRIIREEEATGQYEVLNLLDDISIRKSLNFKKGISIPDLSLSIKLEEKFFNFSIEVDSGKRPTKAIIEKIKWYGGIIIIITTSYQRKKALKKAINRNRSIVSRPLIGIFSEVLRDRSLINRDWRNEGNSNNNLT